MADRQSWRRPDSLRLRLLWGLSLPLLLLLSLDAYLTYQRSLAGANAAFDRMLHTSARAIANGISSHGGEVRVDIPYFALQMFESNAAGKVFYRVSDARGKALTGYEDLPPPAIKRADAPALQFADADYLGEEVRLVSLRQTVRDMLTLRDQDVWVQVAETPESRQELARGLLLGSLLQEVLLVATLLLIVWLAVSRGLRPLRRLSAEVASRKEGELAPLPTAGLPNELTPLVDALNLHGERLQRLFAARRRFIDDAAHQLKTPLAVMQSQAELALREEAPAEQQRQLRRLLDGMRQAGHMVAQLLQMSRLEPDNGQPIALEKVDAAALAREVALEWAAAAHERGADLGYEGAEAMPVSGNRALLRELLNNLLDNALRYAGDGAVVTVAAIDGPQPCLEVRDSGPGIPEAEREKVLLRFYRLAGERQEGSGLGLAIVREIAGRHGARLSLGRAEEGGLKVGLRFPAA
ncbi:sensor histidine kinase [Chromobacterium phragmitis]|uniref:sensor histidine kinase n=1 Tax=Chromobacterium phragmitis TaxID=2202141 RepID=UPI000DEC34DE|nr:sensor histidine kinase [Chromobacterium phragmitis]AXE28893.1 sensor histidine kinase [Chromobacterium phragmitis]